MEKDGLYSKFKIRMKRNLQFVSKVLENDRMLYERWNFFVYFGLVMAFSLRRNKNLKTHFFQILPSTKQ